MYMNRKFLRLLAGGMAIFAALSSLSAAHLTGLTLFGITWAGNQLVSVDPATGAATVVGNLGDTIFATGIASRNGTLYAFDQVHNRLREINKISGKAVSSIDIGVSNAVGEGALAFRSDGVGFLAVPLSSNLQPVNDLYMFTIAPNGSLGTSVRVGSTGVAIDGLAFDSQGTLYALGQDSATLYKINTTTAAATPIGSVTVGNAIIAKNSPIGAITIAPANANGVEEIYASINDRLYIIDPTTAQGRTATSNVINFGPFISSVSGLTFAPGAGTFGNMSARLSVGTGPNVGIGGFIIRGQTGKPVVLRGLGPSIPGITRANLLADPVIELFNSQGQSIARNDNWQDGANATQIANLGLAPSDRNESALLQVLNEGAYTVVLSGASGSTGTGLVEIYDTDVGNGGRLANLSTRGFVGTGDNILIGGVIVSGSANQRVVIRALGPDLGAFGVPNPLQDPNVDLRDANGMSLGTNDNFGTGGQTAELAQNSLTPGDPNDSALITNLPPGNYTALVNGVNSTTGTALVEFYNLTAMTAP